MPPQSCNECPLSLVMNAPTLLCMSMHHVQHASTCWSMHPHPLYVACLCVHVGCVHTLFGCCPDGSTEAKGWNFIGCPGEPISVQIVRGITVNGLLHIEVNCQYSVAAFKVVFRISFSCSLYDTCWQQQRFINYTRTFYLFMLHI